MIFLLILLAIPEQYVIENSIASLLLNVFHWLFLFSVLSRVKYPLRHTDAQRSW
jgi:hypothetical protein